MSIHTIERILWELGEKPARAKAFLEDPDGYLAPYPLTEEELDMVRSMDVRALGDHGVSPLLTMMTWLSLHDDDPLMQFDYLRKMNGGDLPNNMKLPGWQFSFIRVALRVRSAWVGALCFVGLRKSLT